MPAKSPFKAINHLAFITPDLEGTIRFYRDLLGMPLEMGMGHGGFKHYFFKTADNYIAFFAYPGASKMEFKFPGRETSAPIGFDHVAIRVDQADDLFYLRDRLTAAGVEVTGPIDHGLMYSIYFKDNNNIPLEATWDCVELTTDQAIIDDEDVPAALEGAAPRPGHWPDVPHRPISEMIAKPGNGHEMRDILVKTGRAKLKPEFDRLVKVPVTS